MPVPHVFHEKLTTEAEQAPGRNSELEADAAGAGAAHVGELCAPGAEHLHHPPPVRLVEVEHQIFDRLEQMSGAVLP